MKDALNDICVKTRRFTDIYRKKAHKGLFSNEGSISKA